MKVDLSNIIRVNGASLKVEFEEALAEGRVLVEGYILDGPVSFSGILTNMNGVLELDGQLKAGYKGICYRCIKEVYGQIDVKINENFVNLQKTDETDAYTYEGKELELDKVLEDNVILNLPMKVVCTQGCKGLCQTCGANLNEESCDCRKDYTNPRMEVLNKFFN
jgi:uncharacterized protein